MKRLKDRVVFVTGAGSGIGQCVAVALAEEGANLVLASRTEARLEETARQIRALGSAVLFASTDVTDREAVDRLVRQALDRFGGIDMLVNNAGINTKKRGIADMPLEVWDRVVDVNLTGAFNCVRAVLPRMQERQEGLIINIASMAGKGASVVGGAAYGASKFGMVSMTHSINLEQGQNGIRACVICPGEVDTPILEHRPVPVPEARRRNILRSEDIAAAVVYVALQAPRVVIQEIHILPRVR